VYNVYMNSNRKRYTKEDKAWLVIHYPLLGSRACAAKLGHSTNSVKATAYKLGIHVQNEIRKQMHLKGVRQNFIPSVDEKQFMQVKTPEVAYLLGLLWADGWVVSKKTFSVDIKLVSEDMRPLEKIFFATGNWRKYQHAPIGRKPTTHLRASNKKLVEYLVSLGYKAKSYLSARRVLESVPDHLKHYWWRGYLDGDGFISKTQYIIQFSSGYDQDWSFLPKEIPFRIEQYSWGRCKASKAIISQKEWVLKLGEFIYQGADKDGLYLPRKREAFLRMRERGNTHSALS